MFSEQTIFSKFTDRIVCSMLTSSLVGVILQMVAHCLCSIQGSLTGSDVIGSGTRKYGRGTGVVNNNSSCSCVFKRQNFARTQLTEIESGFKVILLPNELRQ